MKPKKKITVWPPLGDFSAQPKVEKVPHVDSLQNLYDKEVSKRIELQVRVNTQENLNANLVKALKDINDWNNNTTSKPSDEDWAKFNSIMVNAEVVIADFEKAFRSN